jgi:hypothetical protein
MNNEPLEREPIDDRVRARLEALLKANAAPRCGARSKRTGKPCQGAAMPNGRCKLHGGKSRGRSRRANWKHGHFSREAKAAHQERIGSIADKRSEGSLDLATVARLHDFDLKPDRGRRRRRIPRHGIRRGIVRINKQAEYHHDRAVPHVCISAYATIAGCDAEHLGYRSLDMSVTNCWNIADAGGLMSYGADTILIIRSTGRQSPTNFIAERRVMLAELHELRLQLGAARLAALVDEQPDASRTLERRQSRQKFLKRSDANSV